MGTTSLTFGQKLREARKKAGLTQEELAEKLAVSRQAVTKWENDKGLPDTENWKTLSRVLNVSIDYLLDNGEALDLSVTREEIKLSDGKGGPGTRWSKKAAQKDGIVLEKFKGGEVRGLLAKQAPTKTERVIDNVLGFLTDAPFGIPEFLNDMKNVDKAFYLVNFPDKQYFVTVTDEFIESRLLAERITQRKFVIGNMRFTDYGVIKRKGD